MIKIMGATGQLGLAVVGHLQNNIDKSEIGAIGRSAAKLKYFGDMGIRTYVADMDNADSCYDAILGADTLLLISGNEVGKRRAQHANAIQAAIKAKVEHIVYTSFERISDASDNPLGDLALEHIESERLIIESGCKYTIMRNNLYSDLWEMFVGGALSTNELFYPAGSGRVNFASRNDMAEAIAKILSRPEEFENQILHFGGSESISFDRIAAILSEISGKEIKYRSPEANEFSSAMRAAGVPEGNIAFMAMFGEAIKQNQFSRDESDMERILGRAPVSFVDYLKKACTVDQTD